MLVQPSGGAVVTAFKHPPEASGGAGKVQPGRMRSLRLSCWAGIVKLADFLLIPSEMYVMGRTRVTLVPGRVGDQGWQLFHPFHHASRICALKN
jgi:hypothetical protein